MKLKTSAAVSGSLLLVICIVLAACEHQTPMTAPPVQLQPTLSSIQANIFTPKCVNAGCHPGGNAPMSLANGQSFGMLVNQASAYNRPRVAPGNANNSALYLKVSGTTLGARMPTVGQPLSAAEVSTIQTWINNGAQNN
ncbi:MAG: hypothetical protein ACREOO_07345 [bacterium]